MTRVARVPYSPAEMQWLADNRSMVISDYHQAFRAAFDRTDVTAAHLHGLRKRLGWKVGRALGRLAGRKQRRRMAVSSAELEWLRTNCTKPIADYHREFCVAFSRADLSAEQLHSLRKREGWRTGRNGRFDKGTVPWSKGKKLPFNAGSARTQFKKGRPRSGKAVEVYKPVGTECIRDGYLVRKIHDGFPMQSRWRAVHLLNWEAVNGPLPDDMVLKCKGGRSNVDLSNWELVPRGVLARLNKRGGIGYDQAPAELKPTIMAVARLQHGIGKRRKQLIGSQRPACPGEATSRSREGER